MQGSKANQPEAPQDLKRTCGSGSNLFEQTFMRYLSREKSRRRQAQIRGSNFRSHICSHIASVLSLRSPIHQFSGGMKWVYFSSSSNHPLWVGRIFHTALGPRSVKHLGQRTKYRTGTHRQTRPPPAISSRAILIAAVAAWVILSVIHNENRSLYPFFAVESIHPAWQSHKKTNPISGLYDYATIDHDPHICVQFVRENVCSILWWYKLSPSFYSVSTRTRQTAWTATGDHLVLREHSTKAT